jgi:ATP-binding cassette subfamily F protein 3
LAALDFFDGTVVMVTHNEMFLHALAERLIVFQNDHIEVFNGSYGEFVENDGWHDKRPPAGITATQVPQGETAVQLTKKEMRRKRSDIIAQRSKITGPLEQRITGLEDEIENHENELDRLNQAMQLASQKQDGQEIAELARAIHANQAATEKAFDELEKITHELDRQNAVFEKQLHALDGQQMTDDR